MPVIQESISLFHSLLRSECYIPPKSPSLTLLGAEIRSPHTVFWEYREGLEYLFTARRVQRKKLAVRTYTFINSPDQKAREKKNPPLNDVTCDNDSDNDPDKHGKEKG